jgi:IPT/TIG domain
MSDFSRSPLELLQTSLQKGYVGLHVEQGVPILDRDLNLQHDLLAAIGRSLFTRYIGDGLAEAADGFAVTALPSGQNKQDFRIAAAGGGPGSFLVGGIEVTIPAPVNYSDQAGVASLTTPAAPQPDPRLDTVYLDVFLVDVDGAADPELTNALDVGMQTSIRLRPAWVVRVAEGAPPPAPPAGHNFSVLAELRRPRGADTVEQSMIKDMRQRGLTMSDLVRRIALIERVLLLPAFATPPFSPLRHTVGQVITINGTNFTVGGSATTVLFGDKPAQVVGTPSATQLQARVPADLVPTGTPFVDVKITVRNAGGAVTSDDTFRAARVIPAPEFASPPFPANGPAGQDIPLNGTNFGWPPVKVRFEGATTDSPPVGTPTDTQIDVTVPTGLAQPGQPRDVHITVTTAGGSDTSREVFRIIVP